MFGLYQNISDITKYKDNRKEFRLTFYFEKSSTEQRIHRSVRHIVAIIGEYSTNHSRYTEQENDYR